MYFIPKSLSSIAFRLNGFEMLRIIKSFIAFICLIRFLNFHQISCLPPGQCVCFYVIVCMCVCVCATFVASSSLFPHSELARGMIAAYSPILFILALNIITEFSSAFPPTILRLECFQGTFISLCAVIILPTPHTLSLPHFIKALWGVPVMGPLGHGILFHYLSTQVIKANLLISPHLHHPGEWPGCYNRSTTTSCTHIQQTNNRFWWLFPYLVLVTFAFLLSLVHSVQRFWQRESSL